MHEGVLWVIFYPRHTVETVKTTGVCCDNAECCQMCLVDEPPRHLSQPPFMTVNVDFFAFIRLWVSLSFVAQQASVHPQPLPYRPQTPLLSNLCIRVRVCLCARWRAACVCACSRVALTSPSSPSLPTASEAAVRTA